MPRSALSTRGSDIGILTYAYGHARFMQQAIAMAQSAKRFNPGLALACVTDDTMHTGLNQWFDVLIPYNPAFGSNLRQKLFFDKYTPFQETLFIDSDCLLTGPLDELVLQCRHRSFAVLGYPIENGWWYMDVAQAIAKYNLEYIPRFNGGFYYFQQNPESAWVFNKARQIGRIHTRMRIYELGEWFNEEVFYAIALAAARIEPILDVQREGMYTPDQFQDPFHIDILAGEISFPYQGVVHRPRVVHFFGHHVRTFHYLRERIKLRLRYDRRWATILITGVSAILNVAYFAFVKLYQLISLLRGKHIRFRSTMPLVPFSSYFTTISKRFFPAG